MKRYIVFAVALFFATNAVAAEWPPSDPGEYVTKTNFSLAWAKHLRGFHTLADLQKAAGSKGTISSRSLEGDDPYVAYHWRSEPPRVDDVGYMLATVRPNGQIGVSIMTTSDQNVTMNTKGAFMCDECKPHIFVAPLGYDNPKTP